MKTTPYARWQDIDVTFNSTASADTVIDHALNPPDPYDVVWEVIGLKFFSAPGTVPVIYQDTSITARAWTTTSIVLRSNVASLKARLRLSLPE